MTFESPVLNAPELRALAERHSPKKCQCLLGPCAGWESLGAGRWPEGDMHKLGTLRATLDADGAPLAEPSFEEFHPEGTRYDSPDAPIAVDYFPYNRCDVFACSHCGCGVLKYTEYGGYYVDHRVRLVNPDLVVTGGT